MIESKTIGEVRMFSGNFEPEGWYFCDGRSLRVDSNQLLYSVLGISHGGDGENFNLPNLPNFNGVRYIICFEGEYPKKRF